MLSFVVRLQDQELHTILLKDDINTWYMGSKTMDQVLPSAVSLSPCLQHPNLVPRPPESFSITAACRRLAESTGLYTAGAHTVHLHMPNPYPWLSFLVYAGLGSCEFGRRS